MTERGKRPSGRLAQPRHRRGQRHGWAGGLVAWLPSAGYPGRVGRGYFDPQARDRVTIDTVRSLGEEKVHACLLSTEQIGCVGRR